MQVLYSLLVSIVLHYLFVDMYWIHIIGLVTAIASHLWRWKVLVWIHRIVLVIGSEVDRYFISTVIQRVLFACSIGFYVLATKWGIVLSHVCITLLHILMY